MHFPQSIFKRILISFTVALVFAVGISEIPFIFLRETARPPKQIVLTIPAGTAAQVARGEKPPSIPDNMIFVVGDTLVVKNQDAVDHKLGPLWIPAHSSAQLPLDEEEKLAFQCSFQPTQVFGLDVREPLTAGTRIFGILFVAIPMASLIALYSLLIPSKKKEHVPA